MITIEDLTKEDLFEIANISTGGYFKSDFSSGQQEIETGGYGKRRLVIWVFEGNRYFFEIDAETKDRGWHWNSWVIDSTNTKHNINVLDIPSVVDYCDERGIDIRNKKKENIMKVQATDTFFKSLKKLIWHESKIYKFYSFFRRDIPYFFKNIWNFRKLLWNFRWWDHTYILQALYAAIYIVEKNTRKRGNEAKRSQEKKLEKMKRSLEIIKNIVDSNYIEMSEKVHGELPDSTLDFVDIEDKPGFCELVDNDTDEEKEFRRKVYDYSDKLEKDEWDELWNIMRGQNRGDYDKWLEENKHNYTESQIRTADAWYDWFDGSGLSGWWD